MEVREDFITVKDQLLRLVKYGEVFEENNLEHWPHLKHKEDFQSIYDLGKEDRTPLEKIYAVGRDCAISMSEGLRSFNNAREHPTLTTFIKSFDRGWVYQIDDLRNISAKAKKTATFLKQCPWAVEQMIILFDEQLKLLDATRATLKLLKRTDLYKIENPNFFYNLGLTLKVWKDPVWSKVIAATIVFIVGVVWSLFHYWLPADKITGKSIHTKQAQTLDTNRIITLKQKSKIVDVLLANKGRISIAIVYVRGDRKAEQYAQEIRDIFNSAYWHTSIEGATFPGFDSGLMISANKMSGIINVIITAFDTGDINIKPWIDPHMKNEELQLKVGSP